jgi:hypothetical protein
MGCASRGACSALPRVVLSAGLTCSQRPSSLAEIFKRRAVGRCFRCLASDHLIADYRDPPKCLLFKSDHRARHCRSSHPKPPPPLTHYPSSKVLQSTPLPMPMPPATSSPKQAASMWSSRTAPGRAPLLAALSAWRSLFLTKGSWLQQKTTTILEVSLPSSCAMIPSIVLLRIWSGKQLTSGLRSHADISVLISSHRRGFYCFSLRSASTSLQQQQWTHHWSGKNPTSPLDTAYQCEGHQASIQGSPVLRGCSSSHPTGGHHLPAPPSGLLARGHRP